MIGGFALVAWPAEFFKVQDNIHRTDTLLGSPFAPGDAIRASLQRGTRGWSERAANERSWRESYVGAALGPARAACSHKTKTL